MYILLHLQPCLITIRKTAIEFLIPNTLINLITITNNKDSIAINTKMTNNNSRIV